MVRLLLGAAFCASFSAAAAAYASSSLAATEHLLLQVDHRGSVVKLHTVVEGGLCCDTCGEGFCSPQSGNCYETKAKSYYVECSPSCCGSCGGGGFCSPRSGNCYDAKNKDYYQSCSTDGGSAPAPTPTEGGSVPPPSPPGVGCCNSCGEGFCSPQSGNCYETKAKSYYVECSPSCCGSCGGEGFCSPRSGNCYDAKNKDYYQSCCTDGGSAPAPTPAEGGLVPPPAPPGGGCCNSCDKFCSPMSNSCYDSQRKPYYLNCNAEESEYNELVWFDEFDGGHDDGTVNRSKWAYMNGPNPHNQELQYYTDRPDNSYVADGKLKIVAKCEQYLGRRRMSYTSARIVTKDIVSWGPGHRVEVRAKNPVARGAWPAIWMMPQESVYGGWPKSGEIDIMESVGCTRGSVYGTIHTGAYNHMTGTQKGRKYATDEDDWHVYSIEWGDSYIHWFVDGMHYNTFAPDDLHNSAKWPFNQAFYLILNVAVGGSWGGFCLNGGPSCSPGSSFARGQVMEFDYVRVYAKSHKAKVVA